MSAPKRVTVDLTREDVEVFVVCLDHFLVHEWPSSLPRLVGETLRDVLLDALRPVQS